MITARAKTYLTGALLAASWLTLVSGTASASAATEQGGQNGENADTWRRSGVVWILRLGLMLTGRGGANISCTGDCSSQAAERLQPSAGPAAEHAYLQQLLFLIGGDVLYQATPWLRLGGGLWFLPDVNRQLPGKTEDLGSALVVPVIAEGLLELAPGYGYVAPRGLLALSVMNPRGELYDDAQGLQRACELFRDEEGGSCDVDSGPYYGLTYGVGVAFVVPVASFRARGELLLLGNRWSLLQSSVSTADGSDRAQQSWDLHDLQFWSTIAVEL